MIYAPSLCRRAWKRRAFIRLPHIFISHHRRVWFLLVSRNSHRQVSLPQARSRSSMIGVISSVASALVVASVFLILKKDDAPAAVRADQDPKTVKENDPLVT